MHLHTDEKINHLTVLQYCRKLAEKQGHIFKPSLNLTKNQQDNDEPAFFSRILISVAQ